MDENNYCECGMPCLEGDGNCSKCNKSVSPVRLKLIAGKPEYRVPSQDGAETPDYESPGLKVSNLLHQAGSLDEQIAIGNSAAVRTEKYSTLFEKIGSALQMLNSIGAVILLVAGFFITGPGWIKFIYWVAILLLWALSYIQTALIRGLASYFQMKASDHLVRYWKK